MKYADIVGRAVAYLLDLSFLGLVFFAIAKKNGYTFDMTGLHFKTSVTGFQIFIFMTTLLYFALFESSPWQATPFKRLQKMKVMDLKGERIRLGRALWRAFLKTVTVGGVLFVLISSKSQGLHDFLAGTIVCEDPGSSQGDDMGPLRYKE
jgi:uncharacterized RDD family membrane protein YckC